MGDLSSFGDMKEIVEDFLIETDELLSILDEDLITYESNPEDASLLERIFRVVHTIKGTAGFLGFESIVEVVHISENILNKLRHGELKFTAKVNDGILLAFDRIKVLLNDVRNGGENMSDISDVIALLTDIHDNGDGGGELLKLSENSESSPASSVQEVKEVPVQQVEVQNTTSSSIKEKEESKTQAPSVPPVQEVQNKKKEEATTIRVDVSRLDSVMDLVGELVLGRNRLTQTCNSFEKEFEEHPIANQLNEISNFIDLVISDLQLAVMKTRMQPVRKVFSKFPRMVRDLAKSQKKDIALEISGEDTELDKSVIEAIGDPLVHIIRNSCDHGIETPEERAKAGKSPKGLIRLNAYYEGNNIIIEIKDDGKGMDPVKIKQKVLEKGLCAPEDLAGMSDKDILNFIFKPGFSTAEKITDVSGRGVGMDVVKTNISRLNGLIDIDSELGRGSALTITLPLTVAIIQTLMVVVEDEIYAIPLASVLQTLIIPESEVKTVDQNEVINYRGNVLPLIRLSDVFDLTTLIKEKREIYQNFIHAKSKGKSSAKEPINDDNLYIIVIGMAELRLGVIVDSVLGQEEIVLKSFGEYIDAKGLSGATIMGDGCVTLVVDIEELFEIAEETVRVKRRRKEVAVGKTF